MKRLILTLIVSLCLNVSATPFVLFAGTNHVTQWGVTWTCDANYPSGQFANGDWWVVGPVKIVSIDPPSVTDSTGRTMNGSMLNPVAGCALPQGYDSAMPSNTYDPVLNVAAGVSRDKPLLLPPGSSLISSVSLPAPGSIPQLDRAAILTILAFAPEPNSFRPPYCGTDKSVRFKASRLDYSLLKKLAPVAGTPAWSDVENQFAHSWIEHAGGWTATALRPQSNMPNYGREMHTAIGVAGLMLHLNASDTQKKKILVEYVQLGIDLYGVAVNGGNANWTPEGGQSGGRKWPILFAGIMLGDPAMKNIGSKSGDYLYQNGHGPGNIPPEHIAFGEDDQTFYVTQADIDATNSPGWKPDSRDIQKLHYSKADLGLPEWGIDHSRTPAASNKWWPTEYRQVAGPPFHGTALAALLTDGGKTLWNHPAYFDYCDRYMQVSSVKGDYPGWRSLSDFTENMWDAYRVQCGTLWTAKVNTPPVLVSPGNKSVNEGQLLTFTLVATDADKDPVTYGAANLPAGATLAGPVFAWTPTYEQAGTYSVTFTASDGQAQDTKTVTLTVVDVYRPPAGTKPVYRFRNRQTGSYVFTLDDTERANLTKLSSVWTAEGIVFYAYPVK
jgi:hypothetical protein